MSTLSPTTQAPLAGAHDLRLRTTVRRDDVDVWTSLIVPGAYFETLVRAPEVVTDAMRAIGMPTESYYATKADAEFGHRQVVTRVGMLLQRLKESA